MDLIPSLLLKLGAKGIAHLLEPCQAPLGGLFQQAADKTALSFPEIEGIAEALARWRQRPKVRSLFEGAIGGTRLESEEELVHEFTVELFLGSQPQSQHGSIVASFLKHLESEILQSEWGTEYSYKVQMKVLESIGESGRRANMMLEKMVPSPSHLPLELGGLVDRAEALYRSGRTRSAEELLVFTIDQTQDQEVRSDALSLLAAIRMNHGQDAEAAKLFGRSVELSRVPEKTSRRGILESICRGDLTAAERAAKVHRERYPEDGKAAFVLAEIYVRSGRLDEALAALRAPERTGEHTTAIGSILLCLGRAEESLRELEQVDAKARSTRDELLICQAELMWSAATTGNGQFISEDRCAILRDTASRLDVVINSLGEEDDHHRSLALCLLAGCRALSGDYSAAVDSYRRADLLLPLDAQSLCNLAVALQESGQSRDALIIIDRAHAAGVLEDRVIPLKSLLRAELGEDLPALADAREWFAKSRSLEAGLLVAELALKNKRDEVADSTLQELRSRFPDAVEVLVLQAKVADLKNQLDQSEELWREAARMEIATRGPGVGTLQAARWFSRRARFNEASEFYHALATAGNHESFADEVLVCFFNAQRWDDALLLAGELNSSNLATPISHRVVVACLEQSGSLREAQSACALACAKHPADVELLLMMLRIGVRLRDEPDIRFACAALESTSSPSSQVLMSCAEARYTLLDYEGCLAVALRALRADRDSAWVAHKYFSLFTRVPPGSGFLRPHSVASGTRVNVRVGESSRHFEIVSATSSIQSSNQHREDSLLGLSLVGRRVGDEVVMSEAPRTVGIVEEICSVYVWEFQQLPVELEQRFRDPKSFRRVPVDDDLESIKAFALECHENQLRLINAYQSELVPAGMIAELRGMSLCQTWEGLLLEPSIEVACSTGSPADAVESARFGSAVPIVLDTTTWVTLWTLGRLGLLDHKHLDVITPQAVVDDVESAVRESRAHSHSDGGWLRIDGGKLSMVKISEEDKQKEIARLEELLDHMRSTRVVPRPLGPVPGLDRRLEKMIGSVAVASIEVAAGHRATLLCDDLRLRMLARQACGLPAAWTLDLAIECYERGLLLPDDVVDVRLKLLQLHVQFVPIDVATIIEALRRDAATPHGWTDAVLRAIAHPSTTLDSAIQVLAAVVRQEWLSLANDSQKATALGRILDVVLHKGGQVAVRKLSDESLRLLHLVPMHAKSLQLSLDAWCRVRLIT